MSFCSLLESNKFMVTAEISPPKGNNLEDMLKNAYLIKDITDAVNVTDNQRAVMRMSPVAACSILREKGFETIMHLTCRDRNRMALQSDLLGASALGINNILVMSGDHPVKGDHAGAKPVYDLDSVQLLELIRKLNRGYDLAGNMLDGITNICAGAVTNTNMNEVAFYKFQKKINMGARFFQTQAVFDIEHFSQFMNSINKKQTVKIIAGIIPLRSLKNALFLNSKIAGIKVPDEIIKRMRRAKDQGKEGQEGIKIASELISGLRSICDGVHIMPIGSHENTREILEMAGII